MSGQNTKAGAGSKFSGLLAAARGHEADQPDPTDVTTIIPESPAMARAETAEAPRRGRPRGKRSDPDYEQVTAYIRGQTHRDVKIALLREGAGREFSELVEELLADWLQQPSF